MAALGLAAIGAVTDAVTGATVRALRGFLDYYAGVFTLVALTATVVWGLISTGTAVAAVRTGPATSWSRPRRRLAAQAVHRATGVAALGCLVLHIGVKVAERHATLAETLVPYGVRGRSLLMGLGTLAAYLLVLAVATGALRSAFTGRGRALWWRVLHAGAYPAWCGAIVHGLKAGRPAAGWVVASYVVCLIAVSGALAARLASPAARRGSHPLAPLAAQAPETPPLPVRPRRVPGRTPARARARRRTAVRGRRRTGRR